MAETWYFCDKKAHVWKPYCDGYWFLGYKSLCGLIEGQTSFGYMHRYNGWQDRCKTCTRLLALKKVA